MKIKLTDAHAADIAAANLSLLLRDSIKELAALHKENDAMSTEIRKLQVSTRKKLDRIEENLRHVQASR
jgi:hypothetical protein